MNQNSSHNRKHSSRAKHLQWCSSWVNKGWVKYWSRKMLFKMYSKLYNSHGLLSISWLLPNSDAVAVSHGSLPSDNTQLNFSPCGWPKGSLTMASWALFFNLKIKINLKIKRYSYLLTTWGGTRLLKNLLPQLKRCRVRQKPCNGVWLWM